MMLVVTCIFVVCYKYRCLKVSLNFFYFIQPSVHLCLAGTLNRNVACPIWGVSFLVHIRFDSLSLTLSSILTAFNIPMDYFTFSIILWNFTAVGMAAVFWRAPMRVNQGYLIFISAIMVRKSLYTSLLRCYYGGLCFSFPQFTIC